MKKIGLITKYLMLTMFFVPGLLTAQEKKNIKIISSTIPVTINKIYLSVKQLQGKVLNDEDTVAASYGDVSISLSYGSVNAMIVLPLDKKINIKDLTSSSYCTLSGSDSYTSLLGRIWGYFMRAGESHEKYYMRVQRERGGIPKGGDDDILSGSGYTSYLRFDDAQKVKKMNDSLAVAKVSDSIVYYLSNAMFYEENDYLIHAYTSYRKAYRNMKARNMRSPSLITAFSQFLYRMGRKEEAENID